MSAPLIVEIAVEPANRADREPFRAALQRLLDGDASLAASEDRQAGQTILRATEEHRLNAAITGLQRDFDQRLHVGALQVTYRETLARIVEMDYTHNKQSGGSGQFGRVKVRVVPGERGSGIQFFDEVKDGNIPREYIPSVEKGMREIAATGSLIGFPIIDFNIHLVDGAYHDVDSSALAFEIAGRGVMREAAQKSGIKLLEPIMKVEVVTPEDFMGDVIGDLDSRRGQIHSANGRNNAQVVEATVPLANMFGYAKQLRSFTQGRANCVMQFSHYAPRAPDFDPDDSFPSAAALRA